MPEIPDFFRRAKPRENLRTTFTGCGRSRLKTARCMRWGKVSHLPTGAFATTRMEIGKQAVKDGER
jgi:hypothetical protein